MDPLSDFLDGPRARGAFLMRVIMRPPWSIAVSDEAPLTLVQQMAGKCWFRPDDGPAQLLRPGDTLVVRAPCAYSMSSDPEAEATILVGAEQICSDTEGRDLSIELAAGVRTWGNDPAGEDSFLVGTYRSDGEVGRMVLAALPAYIIVPSPAPEVAALLQRELVSDDLAQSAMLDRLLDLLLIATVRSWGTSAQTPPTLLAAARDELVQRALRLIQDQPEADWTVESLARVVGISRPALARRFTEVVGVPPMTYLTQWRLAVGADLLRDQSTTIAAISRQVGYANQFSFSTAFKRHYGLSPQHYRRRPSA